MTEQTQDAKTVEQLQDEIQKLKDKNTQLLSEKRAAVAQRDEMAEKLAAVEKERDETTARLDYLTIQLPRDEILQAAAVEDSAEILWRELSHHVDVVRDDDGQDYFHDKEGKRLEHEGQPVTLTVKGLNALYDSGAVKTIGRLLKSSGATGGGATGSRYRGYTTTDKAPTAKPSGFGLR